MDTYTDAQGGFVFDNLSDREYMLRVDNTYPEGTTMVQMESGIGYRKPHRANYFRPQAEPVEVRITAQPPPQP